MLSEFLKDYLPIMLFLLTFFKKVQEMGLELDENRYDVVTD